MADSWVWWIMISAISLYFVMMLLDFNKPSKKLMEQINQQEGQERVLRGGFFAETRPNVRTTNRNSTPEIHTRENVGFRLAISDQDG